MSDAAWIVRCPKADKGGAGEWSGCPAPQALTDGGDDDDRKGKSGKGSGKVRAWSMT